MYDIQQGSASYPLLFLMVLSSDHISPATGLSPTVTIRKPGGAFAAPAGAVTEIANGWYQVAGNATDSNTLGPLILHATAATADPSDPAPYNVVAYNPQDATALGLARLDAAISSRMATFALPANFAALAISAGGLVFIQAAVKKNVALAGVTFVMTDSTTHAPKPALVFGVGNTQVSLDGAAFVNTANVATEVGNGVYKIGFAAADLNANTILFRASIPGADDTLVSLLTFP